MPRLSDSFLRSDEFKVRLTEADTHAKAHDLDKWGTRIVWVGLVYGPLGAKRFAQRRSHYTTSRAWRCYCNLVDAGLFSEEPEGIVYDETPKYETDEGVMLWFDTLCRIAEGGIPIPNDLPRFYEEPPKLRVVNGGR